ncbi:Rha family transcriptional regulator [Asaia spathodeae]|uniref:Rha family transcriptional regulator n=1 Tax=Asaia spathodeae TaxID=657016 RepID=UPI002FC3C364
MATEPTIINVLTALTMSSREIAELTGKRHDNVIRDIEKMLEETGMGLLSFEDTYRNEQNGQEYRCFNLPKNLTIVLVSGYRADLRLKIVDRWMALEAAVQTPMPLTREQQLADAFLISQDIIREKNEQIGALSGRLIEAEQSVAVIDHCMNIEGLFGLQQAGRILHQKPNLFVRHLKTKWLIHQGGELVPRAQYGMAGSRLFDVKWSMHGEKNRAQSYVTPKGIEYFAKHLGVVPDFGNSLAATRH